MAYVNNKRCDEADNVNINILTTEANSLSQQASGITQTLCQNTRLVKIKTVLAIILVIFLFLTLLDTGLIISKSLSKNMTNTSTIEELLSTIIF